MDANIPPVPERRRRSRILLAALVVLAAAVAGVTVYAFRSRLATVPVVGSWFGGNGGATATTGQQASESAPMAGMPMAGGGGEERADARAEVSIDPKRQQLIGVRTAAVERTSVASMVRAIGIVRYDETRQADVNVKLEGWIRDLYVNYTGQLVAKGQPLFTLYSPDLVATQTEYLLALKSREQMETSKIADAREYAGRLAASARQRLVLWDLPPEEIRALEETREPRTAITFRSPVSGYVIEKQVLQGLHVMPGQTLYKIADVSRVWVEADIYEQEMASLRVGGTAVVRLDAYPDEEFRGRVTYIYPFVEEKTRTVRARLEFANPRGRLKPGMYANVELQAPAATGLSVPADAVLDSGKRQLVFVALGDGYFEPRDVKIGRRVGDRVEILANLKEGEQVATGATFFLDSESQLRAATQSYEAPQSPTEAGAGPRERLDITLRPVAGPLKVGDNMLEVSVKDPSGQPIADAEVSVTFFMAAMPTMNMPAMRNEAKLQPVGNGVYRGSGQVMMAGQWNVTVNVGRGGQRLGSKQFPIGAR